MAVRILANNDGAVLYCSTSGWAFGPLFESKEEAERFLSWLDNYYPADEDKNLLGCIYWRHDPRELNENGLQRAYSKFLTTTMNK